MPEARGGPKCLTRSTPWAALLACALTGCLAAPRPASSIVPQAETPAAHALSPDDHEIFPAGYWKQTGAAGAASLFAPGRKAVITEFGVELVDLQAQGPFERQMAINPPPIFTGPITPIEFVAFGAGVCANVVGLGRKNSRLAEEQQQQLAHSLLDLFSRDLSQRGLVVLPLDRAQASSHYADLRIKPKVRSSLALLLNPIGSDTGTVLRTHTVAAPGAGVVTRKQSSRLAVEQLVLRDSGADIAVAVRLRVGIFRKKAALEEGSVVRLITADGETLFKAKHSILSDKDAIESSKFKLFIGAVEPLASEDFRRELEAMLPKFLELAYRQPLPPQPALRPMENQNIELTRLPPTGEEPAARR